MPSTVSIPYSVSKTALNALTLEMAKFPENEGVQFHVIGLGHCKTEFNGFRGLRDPLEGANVVVELVNAEKGTVPNAGFWQTEGASKETVSYSVVRIALKSREARDMAIADHRKADLGN
jgi:NAD(P)-dependent dehydrogenase (short-subunit alcohol dehydrogenase family)